MAASVKRRRRSSWKGGSRSEPPLYEPSAEDQWSRAALRRVALAIGKWLSDAEVTHRPVHTLKIHELEGLAWAAIAEWTDARCERYDAEEAAEINRQRQQNDLPLDRMIG